jgi:hypothetical protein
VDIPPHPDLAACIRRKPGYITPIGGGTEFGASLASFFGFLGDLPGFGRMGFLLSGGVGFLGFPWFVGVDTGSWWA